MKYKERLKEEDYLAWDALENDPMITGNDSDSSWILPIVVVLILISLSILAVIH